VLASRLQPPEVDSADLLARIDGRDRTERTQLDHSARARSIRFFRRSRTRSDRRAKWPHRWRLYAVPDQRELLVAGEVDHGATSAMASVSTTDTDDAFTSTSPLTFTTYASSPSGRDCRAAGTVP